MRRALLIAGLILAGCVTPGGKTTLLQVRGANDKARKLVASESGVDAAKAAEIDELLQAVEKGVAAVLYYEYEMRPVPPPGEYDPEIMNAAIADMKDAWRLSDIWKAVVPSIPYVGPFLTNNEATYGFAGVFVAWIMSTFFRKRKEKKAKTEALTKGEA